MMQILPEVSYEGLEIRASWGGCAIKGSDNKADHSLVLIIK
ncbi:hypothetical protein [uncultured Clostridium sp.]|nr:hypothetical protein [uncultured Clostridium sp.]